MNTNKTLKIKRNIIAGIVNKIIMMLCPFIIRTIIIWKLGIEYVGLSSLFTSILQILSLAELGFGTAITYNMYEPLAKKDKDLVCALLAFYKKVYKIIGWIILIIGMLILPFLKKFISGTYPSDINIYILFFIYLINTVISYFFFAYKQSLLLANQRNDIESNIMTISYCFMYIFQIVSLLLFKNYYCYIVFLPICTVMINLLRNEYVKKKYSQYKCYGTLNNDIKKEMKKRVFGLMLSRICQVCRNSFDSIVISAALGLATLGKYQNYYYIMNTIIGFLTIITTSIVAGIGNNIVTKTIEENYKQFNIFMHGYNWLASWCTICLCCLYQPFIKIWVGEENMFSMLLVVLMCIYFYSLKVGDIVAVYKEAAGMYWEDRKRPIVESVANLVLNFSLVYFIGVYGVVISTIISIIFINIPWSAYVLFKNYFKKSIKPYIKSLLINFLILVIITTITYGVCSLVHIGIFQEFILKILICIILPNIMIFYVYKNNEYWRSFANIICTMIVKK